MSEARNNFGRNSITRKTKKLQPRVDLTAMINVSYLLIVFFMLTSYLSKPQVMDLSMPSKDICCGSYGCFLEPYQREMTLLLGENNKVISYVGWLNHPLEEPKSLSFNKNSLRKELMEKSAAITEITGDPKRGLIVIIKPSVKCNYKNLVDVLDEMAIVRVSTYVIADITAEEEKLLAVK